MRKMVSSLVCLLLLATSSLLTNCTLNAQTIKGNGKIVTKEYTLQDYHEISLVGSAQCDYIQSDATPSVSVTIDENLLEYLDVKVNKGELTVGPKQKDSFGMSYNLRPTTYQIKANSAELESVDLAGSGSFSAGALQTRKLDLDVAGSGSVTIEALRAEKVDCDVAGSGNVLLKGHAEKASYDIAGSGNVNAIDCESVEIDAALAGSGNLEVYATKMLKGGIVGSGSIYYKGNPVVKSDILGSGKVIRK